jgi:hypothetical protein
MTTDLSKISDPSSVDSFTLDWYEEGWVVWTETIDLSTPEALAALDNLDEYVIIDSWYFYMEWEFWAIWETPVAVTLHNPEIVAAPVIYKDGKPADVGEVTVVKNAEGGSDIKFTAKEGGKYEVKHAIVLDNSPVTSTKGETYKLSGYVTDPKAKLVLTVNGEVLGEAIVADPITGKFEKILNVILGNNSIALAASGTEGDILPASLTVNRGEGTSPWVYVLILLMIIALGLHISTRSRNKVIA